MNPSALIILFALFFSNASLSFEYDAELLRWSLGIDEHIIFKHSNESIRYSSLQQTKLHDEIYVSVVDNTLAKDSSPEMVKRFIFVANLIKEKNNAMLSQSLLHDYMKVFTNHHKSMAAIFNQHAESAATACYYLSGFFEFEDGSGLKINITIANSWDNFLNLYSDTFSKEFLRQCESATFN
ncbi:hypothetical protein [Bacterioplanoides sp.]|uniref:hypothetical protein n=1 Tax=Bacterioplanoides sp. TaxID=2066072 RepID=UPI003B0071CE